MSVFVDAVSLLLVATFLVQAFVFVRFYSRYGMDAVYCAPYAWCIDLCAIASGTFLMGLALFIRAHPELFTMPVPTILVIGLFVLGSWQALIHAVKWWLRAVHKKC
jgi:hypothetical protein